MHPAQPLALLGGISPRLFMRRHWQKKPLLIRSAVEPRGLLERNELFALAGRDEVEARLITTQREAWEVRNGPFGRRALPTLRKPWTLLVQGMDLHHDGMHRLLQRFRFAPDARLDDVMVSYATDGGGVGAHFDSYDVFLLQIHGRRRWRIGKQRDLSLRADLPLKILARFAPSEEHVLEPGDMLYLPPQWAHEGVALGECMTCSIGFRAPERAELGSELLARLADAGSAAEVGAARQLYRDPAQAAVAAPARIPVALERFASGAVKDLLRSPSAVQRALGEFLTEPKPQVWFSPAAAPRPLRAIALDRRTRMMYDARHVFINGDAHRAGGRDATLLRRLAEQRTLDAADVKSASAAARSMLAQWCAAGWLHADGTGSHG